MNLLNFILLWAPWGPPPQPGNPGGGPMQPCWPPPCVPIDDHIWVLMALMAIYGCIKLNLHIKLKNKLK